MIFLHVQVGQPDDVEVGRTLDIPGLAAGCHQPAPSFQPWEKAERGGALKSMFFWRPKTSYSQPPEKKAIESKDEKDEEGKEKQECSEASAQNQSCKNHQESIDKTVYKLLTRTRKRGERTNPKKVLEDSREKCELRFRGPREAPSEMPVQRRIINKKYQVKKSNFSFKLQVDI